MAGFRKVLVLSCVVFVVESFPRRPLIAGVDTNSRSSSGKDYWSERGFHDALTDHFLASESKARDLMLTGDEIDDFQGIPKIRIPRQRLTPPGPPSAKRKSDLEIMESITLLDGGTQMSDGSIRIRPSKTQSQRKYHSHSSNSNSNEQISPLAYHFQDELEYKPQVQQRSPSIATSYYTLPYGDRDQGKSVITKAPKGAQHLDIIQFQKQIIQPQHHPSLYSPPSTSAPINSHVAPIVVLPPPRAPILQPEPQQPPFNAQLFKQQFKHPFGTESPETSPLAQITATILNTASGAAAVASAAANALTNSEVSAPPPSPPSPPPPSQHISASYVAPQIYKPSTTPSAQSLGLYGTPTTPRTGVVADDEQALQNQLIEPENLAARLTRIYETGRKILYFPKGVVDTVDTMLKQVERNPMVAYWGDKFFAKVFGDTSGT